MLGSPNEKRGSGVASIKYLCVRPSYLDMDHVPTRLRLMPVVLPHELLQVLLPSKGFKESFGTTMKDIRAYWQHVAHHVSWAKDHPCAHDGMAVPLFLYGDDTQMNENGEQMTVVMMGCCLDERDTSMLSHYPLFIYREACFYRHVLSSAVAAASSL